jgi:hypothetical protein
MDKTQRTPTSVFQRSLTNDSSFFRCPVVDMARLLDEVKELLGEEFLFDRPASTLSAPVWPPRNFNFTAPRNDRGYPQHEMYHGSADMSFAAADTLTGTRNVDEAAAVAMVDMSGTAARIRDEVDGALASYRKLTVDLVALREKAALVSAMRDAEIENIDHALELLEAEQVHRQRRCNALQEEMRSLAKRKIEVLSDYLVSVRAQERLEGIGASSESSAGHSASLRHHANANRAAPAAAPPASGSVRSGSPAASARGAKTSARFTEVDTASVQGSSATLRGASPGARAWAKVRRRLTQQAIRVVSSSSGSGSAPVAAPTYACGPLTKNAADGYFSTYWKTEATASTRPKR